MNRISRLFLVLSLATAVLPFVGQAATTYTGHCDVVFTGDSTLHSFTGQLTNQPLKVVCLTNSTGQATLSTRIEIAPRQLTTHHVKRDANMHRMFLSDQFPKLVVVVTNAPLLEAHLIPAPIPTPGRLPVQFTFCGITKEILTTIGNPLALAAGWEFDLSTELSLRDFNLKPPGALFGAITVHDLVKVKAHVKLQKALP